MRLDHLAGGAGGVLPPGFLRPDRGVSPVCERRGVRGGGGGEGGAGHPGPGGQCPD